MGVVKKRDLVLAIVLSLVTCGFYGIYWTISLVNEVNYICDEPEAMSGAMVFLLSLVTCGVYMMIWFYNAGGRLDRAKSAVGLYPSNSGTLYCILPLFGLGIVTMALIQSEVNNLVDAKYNGNNAY